MKNSNNVVTKVVTAALGTSLVWTTHAQGQEPGVLEEILVVADKLNARSAMDTPIAISVVGGGEIEDKSFTSVSKVLQTAPGVVVNEARPGTKTVSIRGISSASSGDPTIGYYLDDLPFAIPPLDVVPDINPYDLSHLEIMRGPQGTLYGASSLGGTIRVFTHDPVHNELSGKLTAGLSQTDGGGDNYKVQGALNIPLVDDVLSMRLAGSRVDQDGYIDLPLALEDNHNDFKDESYRVKLRYTPNDAVEVNTSYWSTKQNAGASFSDENYDFKPVHLVYNSSLEPTGAVAPTRGDALDNYIEYDLANLNATWVLDDYSVYATVSSIDLSWDGSYRFNIVPLNFINDFEAISSEVRLSYSGDSRWAWTLGGFYSDNDGDVNFGSRNFLEDGSYIDVVLSDIYRGSEQQAVFGELQYDVIPNELVLTLGARYFEDDRYEGDRSGTSIAGALAALGIPQERERSFDATTGRVNLSYTPDQNSLYYLNIGEGFRSGNLQPSASYLSGIAPLGSEPEELISYEVGSKLTLLDNNLTLDVAAYYWDWDKIVLTFTGFLPDGTATAFFDNVAQADAVGIDFGVKYTGVEGLILSFSGNFNETEYGADLPGANIAKGDSVAMSPDYNLSLSADYEWPLVNNLRGSVYVAYVASGEMYTYNYGQPAFKSDSLQTLDVRLGVRAANWSLALTADNVTNESDIATAYATLINLGGGFIYQRPRTVGLEFTYHFGD